jgi:outer membrane protein insertion porin family
MAGGASVAESRIRANMATHEGGPFSEEMVERDIKNLYATGLIENVDVSNQEVAGGIKVIVKVSGRGIIGELTFVGNSVVDSGKLKDAVELKVGQSVDESKLFAGQNKIRELYAKKGFADINISYKAQPINEKQGFVRVIYSILEGQKGIINAVMFEGLSAMKESVLRDKMKLKKKQFYHVWGKSGKLDNDALQEDIHTVERAIQDKGYVYAKVLQVRREPVKGDRVNLIFVIDQGRRFNIAEIALDGNKVFAKEELAPSLRSAAGRAYSATGIADDEKMIADYYGSRGYADAHVETSIIQAGGDSVKVIYRVTEGEKSFIRKLNISGNEKTQDRVIRREATVAPGDEYNTVRVEKMRSRLQQMGYFSQVDIRPNGTGTPGYKDLQVDVKEQSTGSINLGAGFSSIDSLTGFLDLTESNFDITNWHGHLKGGGQRFYLGIKAGNKRRDFEISLTEPWFLGHRLSVGADLFYHELFYLSPNNLYNERQFGGAIPIRKPIGEHSYLDLRYTAQDVKIYQIDAKASEQIKAEEGDFKESKIDISFVNDTRDSLFLTRKGHKLEVGTSLIGKFLGGDVDVYGFHASGSQYFNLPGDLILSFDGAASSVHTWGGDSNQVPIFERLFLGGASNLRGFKYRDVGPKDLSGEPLGGTTSLYASAELNFPIIGERDSPKARGAIFYDVGKVTGGPGSLGGGWNSDVGIGLRLYLIPGTPIRIDVGFPTSSDLFNNHNAQFNFTLGYKF